jgi:Na+-driven multidrug efflux pump
MSTSAIIQMAFIVTVTKNSNTPASDYQNIYGAVNAISNLFVTALWGIVNGSRIICSYNYGAKNYKRIRSSY